MKKNRFFTLLLVLFGLVLAGCSDGSELGENEVRVEASAYTLVGTPYQEVVDQLEVWGFTDIETEAVYDIIWGITEEGTTKSVKIGSSDSFFSGDVFDKDTPVLVTYSMKASSDPTKKTYTITWQYEDERVIKTDKVLWGNIPSYTGDTPVKTPTNDTIYTFSGWTPDIEAVRGDQTYTTVFTGSIRESNLVDVLHSESYFIGENYQEVVQILQSWGFTNIETVAVYDIVWNITEPGSTKDVTIDGSDDFKNGDTFDKDVVVVVTYSMRDEDDPTKQTYTITWQNEDGSILKVDEILWGRLPSYTGTTPTKASTSTKRYIFSGWSPDIHVVTGDQIYIAVYIEEDNGFTITWKNADGTILEIDYNVMYGTLPTYDGAVPTKSEDAGHNYEFETWSPTVSLAHSNQIYTATFTTNPKSFTVLILNWNDSEILNQSFNYGETVIEPPVPERQGYVFVGWLSNEEPITFPLVVSANIIVQATYREILPNEMLFEVYKAKVDNVNSSYDDETESILFFGSNPDTYSAYFKEGVYYYKITESTLVIEILVNLTDSTLIYRDNGGIIFSRDFLFKSYVGNVTLADYYYIESLFEMVLNFEGSGVQTEILNQFGILLTYADFNPNWNDLLAKPDKHYDDELKAIIEQLELYVSRPILIEEEGVYTNQFFVTNHSSYSIAGLLFQIKIVDANNAENILYTGYEVYQGILAPSGGVGKYHDIPVSVINNLNIEYVIVIEVIDIRLK